MAKRYIVIGYVIAVGMTIGSAFLCAGAVLLYIADTPKNIDGLELRYLNWIIFSILLFVSSIIMFFGVEKKMPKMLWPAVLVLFFEIFAEVLLLSSYEGGGGFVFIGELIAIIILICLIFYVMIKLGGHMGDIRGIASSHDIHITRSDNTEQ